MQPITFNRTKIIATVGPSSNSKEKLRELILAGTDVFRLNFSHGTHDDHLTVLRYVRELNEELGTHVPLLQDLQGPKIRVEGVEKGTRIHPGETLIITTEQVEGDASKVSTSYQNLPNDVSAGDIILIDDGKLELKVEKTTDKEVHATVVHGGKLKSRKGINLPYTHVSAPCLTEKDLHDMKFGLEHDVEWMALSFVREASDIIELREKIDAAGKETLIIAKIEKPEAVENIDAIIEAADGIMVARGDLGVEIKSEEVPMIQKLIVKKCRLAAKPVIIATQMMESMIENPRPTRAETNDVANAVMDGADTLMLSAETAAGEFPILAVKSMVDTITSVEINGDVFYKMYDLDKESDFLVNDSIIQMGARVSDSTHAKALVGLTKRGYAAFKLASYRPKSYIFIFTDNREFINTMNLVWGVRAIYYNKSESTDSTIRDINKILKEKGYVQSGDTVINLAAMPINKPGRANALKISVID